MITTHKTEVETDSQKVSGGFWETRAALAGTGFIAFLLFLTTLNAGPLWRDETNSINIAQMSSLREFWNNMPFESFPALWLLLLRGYSFLGMASNDAGIRMLGLFIGLGFLGSLWYSARCVGARGPILSIALLGSLPSFLFTVESNRAYGLAMCFLVLSFGMIWRVVLSPTPKRIIWAGIVSILFLHCVYYDTVFLCAMLFAAALVLARRRQWKGLAAMVAMGAVAGATMTIYVPIFRTVSPYTAMIRSSFDLSLLWHKLEQALTTSSSSRPRGTNPPEIWAWVLLIVAGIGWAIAVQLLKYRSHRTPKLADDKVTSASPDNQVADLALFSVVSMLCGAAGYIGFLLKLQFPTESWYYLGLLSLCAISLDGVLTASLPALRPWGFLRIALVVTMLACGAGAVWEEAHTRRTNVDLIADVLGGKAEKGDLIVVQGAWEGLTLDRYYKGPSRWVTVPPIDSHKVHRTDLMWEKMNQKDPMAPVLAEISTTLRNGKAIWVVGYLAAVNPNQPIPATAPPQDSGKRWLGEYLWNWTTQLTAHLSSRALGMKIIGTPVDCPVSKYENLPLMQFSGYQSATANQRHVPEATQLFGVCTAVND